MNQAQILLQDYKIFPNVANSHAASEITTRTISDIICNEKIGPISADIIGILSENYAGLDGNGVAQVIQGSLRQKLALFTHSDNSYCGLK
ncbi:hypothetical protein GWI33_016726 [Rhynchophorus ferrugineus]|uniref:Uncharacterized protein n=1 Tax=Rhynchophorus ferrugineus TaxID=354439 RepID=A0A834IAM0_RHYFE|nr:hypothetical protein GWI33_016726 [Rhynchophorus ferrugineus]